VAAYSTLNVSSLNVMSSIITSTITTSSITTASGYNSNIGNVLYTSLADSGQTAASFTTASLPATAPAGSALSGTYRLTAGASSGAAVMRLSSYTFVVGTTYNFTFTGMQGSQALALYVYQYNSAGTASTQISASVYSITTSAATVSGSFTPNASGTFTGTIVFYFQAMAVNQFVNFTTFNMAVGSMNVGIGTSSPEQTLSIYGTMSVTSASGIYNSFFIKSSSTSTDFASMYFTNNTPVSAYMGLGGSGVGGNFQSNYFIQSPNSIVLNTNSQQTSGTVTMFLSSTGNVGIRTASPLTSLTIQATTSSTGVGTSAYCGIHIIGGNTADQFNGITWSGNNSGNTYTHAGILVQGSGGYGTKMRFYTTNYWVGGQYERMVIDHNGNVGIGTDTPSFLLHGYGNVNGGVEQYFQNASSGSSAWTLIGCRNNSPSQIVMFLNSSTRTGDGGPSVGTLRNDAGSLRLQSAGGNAAGNIFIASTSGLVGIGKTNPSYLLDVNGGIQSNGTSKLVIQNSVNGGTTAGIFYWNGGDDGWASYMATSGGGASFSGGTACTGAYGFTAHAIRNRVRNNNSQGFIWENSSETCLMSIRGDGAGGGMIGSWGVNTLSPGATLDVVGAIRCRDDWYYIQGAYGMYWTSYSRGFVSPEQAGNSYGNVSTWGTPRNTWSGWGVGSKACFMAYGNEFGLHDNSFSWAFYCNGGSDRFCRVAGSVQCSQQWDRLIVYVNGYDTGGGYFYVNQAGGYGMISDERIKKNIQPIAEEPSLTFIKNLQPCIFCLKYEAGTHKHTAANGTETGEVASVCNCEQSGFIAQNVLAAAVLAGIPKSVCNNWYDYEQELGLPDEERKTILGVSTVPIVSHLTNAVKSLINQNTEQAAEIADLEAQLEAALARLEALEAR
jgi:hypothetical protein